jgi:uncharacterized membrane protein
MKKIALFFIAVTIFTSFWNISFATAKSVRIPSVDVVFTILPDGSATVQENRSIEFDGNYTYGFYEIPKTGYGSIENVSLAEGDQYYKYESSASKNPGTFTLSDTSESIRIDYYFNAKDETRTFTVRYTIKDVVTVYQDYGELYWKLQGDAWDFNIGEYNAVVNWKSPIPIENYFIWAHGPLWGEFVKSDQESASLHIKNVPANTFVEIRVLLPSSYFTTSKQDGTIYESVVKEETKWADQANRERNKAKRTILIGNIVKYSMIVISIFLIFLYFFLYSKYGREHNTKKEFVYYREPPSDLKPAIVGSLNSFNQYQNRFLEATILDLIRRKHIQYEEIKGNFITRDHKLIRLENKEDPLVDYESFLMDELLFENKTTVTMKGLKKKYNRLKDWYYKQFQEFKKLILNATKEHEFFDANSNKYSTMAVVIGIILLFVGFLGGMVFSFSFSNDMNFIFMIFIPVGLLYLVGAHALKRRTKKGAEEYAKWRAFSSFMKDFSNLKEYGPNSIIIWERFLVYATIFGIASVVLKALKVVAPNLPDANNGVLFAPAFMAGGTLQFSSLSNAISGISAVSNSVSRVASSSSSSGSGGGGGFSGGGGGGGGGGSGGGFG